MVFQVSRSSLLLLLLVMAVTMTPVLPLRAKADDVRANSEEEQHDDLDRLMQMSRSVMVNDKRLPKRLRMMKVMKVEKEEGHLRKDSKKKKSKTTPAPSSAPSSVPSTAPTMMEEGNLYDILKSTPDLSLLLEVVDATKAQATDLTFLLSQEGIPMTVFAPNNDAIRTFMKGFGTTAPADALEGDDATSLLGLFLHHVIFNQVVTEEELLRLSDGTELETFLGLDLVLTNDSGSVLLNGAASILMPDLEASNGVLHIVDTVLKPKIPELP